MDPGTALGVISLGIQVCHGVVQYYQGWHDCPEDVAHALTCVESLGRTFKLFETALADDQMDPDLKQRIQEAVIACRGGVEGLDQEMRKFGDPSMVKRALRRLAYPFKASTLAKLKEEVGYLLGQLSLAVQLLDMQEGKRLHGVSREALGVARKEIQTVAGQVDAVGEALALLKLQNDNIADALSANDAETAQLTQQLRNIELQNQGSVVGVQKLLGVAEAQELSKVLVWISAPDTTIEHDAARRRRHAGTGEWFLRSNDFELWKSGKVKCLWLHGKVGCCKTVLTSTIVEDMQKHCAYRRSCSFAYFYFTFSDPRKQDADALLRSLLVGLSAGRPLAEPLKEAYDARSAGRLASGDLQSLLVKLLDSLDNVFVVIDALDEAPDTADCRPAVCEALERLMTISSNLSLLVTSRREPDIEAFMRDCTAKNVAIDPVHVNIDIMEYVRSDLDNTRAFRGVDDASKALITKTLSSRADGMFRWAFHQLEALRKLKNKTPSRIEQELESLPRTLDATYDRLLAAIDHNCWHHARRALQWLCFSRNRLRVRELADAMSLDLEPNLVPGDESWVSPEGAIEILSSLVDIMPWEVSCSACHQQELAAYHHCHLCHRDGFELCASCVAKGMGCLDASHTLVELSMSGYAGVRLTHYSFKEYLLSDRIRGGPASRFALTEQGSSAFLERAAWANLVKCAESPTMTGARISLLKYLAPTYHQWLDQLRHGREVRQLQLVASLVCSKEKMERWTTVLRFAESEYAAKWVPTHRPILDPRASAFHTVCALGLRSYAEMLLREGADINATNWRNRTPLMEAIEHAQVRMLRYLVSRGAAADTDGDRGAQVLQMVVTRRSDSMVQILLDGGAEVNAKTSHGIAALHEAAYWGSLLIVATLLRRGAIVDIKSKSNMTPLHKAASSRVSSSYVTRLLLAAGGDADARDCSGFTPLHEAASFGRPGIVELLLASGANQALVGGPRSYAERSVRGTALQVAIAFGKPMVAKILIAYRITAAWKRKQTKRAELNSQGLSMASALPGGPALPFRPKRTEDGSGVQVAKTRGGCCPREGGSAEG